MRPELPGPDSDPNPNLRPGRRHHRGNRAVVGMVVIVVGVLALLDNLNFIDGRALQAYWPLVLIVLGLSKIFSRHWRSRPFGGTVLIVVGASLIAQNLGWLHLDWHTTWPALVILAGLMMVARSFFPGSHGRCSGRWDGRWDGHWGEHGRRFRQSQIDHGNVVSIKSAFSATSLRNDSQDFQGGDIDLSLAGLELDLRQASIVESADLRISSLMSGVDIRVPTDWQVIIQGAPTMGGVEDRTVPPMNPTKRLVIRVEIVMGGLEIRN